MQYSFRKEKLTQSVLFNIKDKVLQNIEKKLQALGLFLYFNKEFIPYNTIFF